jgi:hypothetical protein
MSGSSLAAWSCNDRVVDATVELVNALNCSNNSSISGIKECMKKKTLDEINAAVAIVVIINIRLDSIFDLTGNFEFTKYFFFFAWQ